MKGDSKITFLAKSGSGAKPYTVDFIFRNDQMFVFCSCPAGKYRNFCTHKIRLMQGDVDVLYNDDQCEDLAKIEELVQKSEFLDLIFERSKFKVELREAQYRLEAVKERMRPVEKKMAQAMKVGIKLRN